MPACYCKDTQNQKFIVLTGGPGAGKTAILELARRNFCKNLLIVPEAASIIFSGGFPRRENPVAKKSAQRVIVKVQQELERLVCEETQKCNYALCDRGTLDGLAYWPGDEESFFNETGLNKERELSRYHAVIHLQSPNETDGYNLSNPARTESAALATEIDNRILKVWQAHKNHYVIPSSKNFFEKAARALEIISTELSCGAQLKIESA